MTDSVKQRVYAILESGALDLPAGRFVAGTLGLLIFLNVIAAVLETDAQVFQSYTHLFDVFALISVMIFALEYLVRVWCCTENPLYRDPVRGRLKYMATPVALVDLFVILPFLLLPFIVMNPETLAFIRFFRIFWILKISHYSRALRTFGRVFSAKRGEIFVAFFVMFVLLILGSALIYFAEHDTQPQKFSSVLASMWWWIETMATVGYGAMIPVTCIGKLTAGMEARLCAGLFAPPSGCFASGFVEEINRKKKEAASFPCPHCGKTITREPERKDP
ncbi:ion transporter [Methanoregula sp.]|uniref:ion transporter n=1 Tax=Methanoregula sp. TaxID=2052170 RepID=UPI000CBAFE0A|nr:ion transporter [Methanoregula sp.]PKG33454.1 MAG: potassium channel protein [Methanoregula sp.]